MIETKVNCWWGKKDVILDAKMEHINDAHLCAGDNFIPSSCERGDFSMFEVQNEQVFWIIISFWEKAICYEPEVALLHHRIVSIVYIFLR